MRPVAIIGIFLIVLGVAGLVFNVITYKTNDEVLKVGPVTATAEENHHVAIPPYAGIVAVLIGGALVVVGRRQA